MHGLPAPGGKVPGPGAPRHGAAPPFRALARALLVCSGAVLVLGAVATAVVSLTGGPDDALVPLLTFVALGQVAGVVAGAVAVMGLGRLLRAPAVSGASGGDGAALAGSVDRTFLFLARALLATCVAAATIWVLAQPAAVVGVATGALLAGQVSAVLVATARWMRSAAEIRAS